MKDVDNNLHYKKHMLNLSAILNHEDERATILAGTGILCLITAETNKCCDWIVSYLPL